MAELFEIKTPVDSAGAGEARDGDRFAHLRRRHPCLGEAQAASGRLHLPVSPECNIQCRFCRRAFNRAEARPGVSQGIIAPEEAPNFVVRALELCPEIAVVGIAGPGDALASGHAIEAFGLIHARFPGLILCMSTNGLELAHNVERVAESGVSTLTVTVNASDPEIAARVVAWVRTEGRTLTGREAGALLIRRQLEGIRKAATAGIFVKANMVLVPGVNDGNVAETARAVRESGASIFNLIPLIPQGDFADLSAPSCGQLAAARHEAELRLPVFRHCQHCRADACGVPGGTDFSEKLYGSRSGEPRTFSHG
jgi:nitrogen fixation protein NifB